MRIDLIQRGTFRKVDIDKVIGLDALVGFDYMGSAEFEWGALPKSLQRMMKEWRSGNVHEYKITIKKENFIVWSKTLLDNGKEIEDFMSLALQGKTHTKEAVCIDRYFEGETVERLKRGCVKKMERVTNYGYCNFWWDIENDWMLYPTEYNEKVKTAFLALDAKRFGL